MKSDLQKLSIKWECSKLGTPKKLTSWDELYKMVELASEDKSKDMNPRLLNAKKSEDWTHHTFSCIDIDRPDDGYVEKIMQSNVMQSFSNIIFIQKSYSGKLHIVYQIPETDDFEIARLYICSYIQQFIDWCDEKFGIKFTATDKRQIRNSYRIATSSPELIYDEGDIDLKFASNKVQPVYINSNEIIANEDYNEWSAKRFFDFDCFMVMYVEEYFKYMVTNVGIQLCNEGKAEYPLYSKDADEVFDESKGKLSELFTNILNDSELDSNFPDSIGTKKVIEAVRSVIKDYYVKLFSNNNLDSNFPDTVGNSIFADSNDGKKGPNNDRIGKNDIYSTDFQEVKKQVPYCSNSFVLDYSYESFVGMIDKCTAILSNQNVSYRTLLSHPTLYKPYIDVRDGIRFDRLPKYYFFDEKIDGKDAKKYIKQTIKAACLNAAASINNFKSNGEDGVYSNFEEYCFGMVISTVIRWIDRNVKDEVGRKDLIEYFHTVRSEWDKISVGVEVNKYKCIHNKLETKEDIIKYAREVSLPKKYKDVEATVIKVINDAYPDSNDFDVSDIVELLNNYNGTGVQTKQGSKWSYKSVCRFFNKFGGLKGLKMRRLGKLKK